MNNSAFMSRRTLLATGGALLAATSLMRNAHAQAKPIKGGTLNYLVDTEPSTLVAIADTTSNTLLITGKMTEGLYSYNLDLSPKPQLALSHKVSADGKEIVFQLRPGVKWHDGQPFTAEDVAFSLMVLKEKHPRGRATYANVTEAVATGPLEVTLRLKNPAPYLLAALNGSESPIIPKHIYEGSDPAANPQNVAPIGTGPFVFKSWERGSHLILERNPNYWDGGKPYLDRIIVRFISDPAARSIAFETGEVDAGGVFPVAFSDRARMESIPGLAVETKGYAQIGMVNSIELNLENQYLNKVEVRQAMAHAIDKKTILENIFYGYGSVATGPIHRASPFYTGDVPLYPHDIAKANELLDKAGLPRDAQGVRFAMTHDPIPIGGHHMQIGEYLRQAWSKVGISVTLRNQDVPTYVKRVYTARDFDSINNSYTNGPDPTLGVQRFFWSKNFRPGVAFTNCSKYSNPRVDELLEGTQIELDTAKRTEMFREFQRIEVTELPTINTVCVEPFTLYNKRLHDHTVTADGLYGSLVDAWLES